MTAAPAATAATTPTAPASAKASRAAAAAPAAAAPAAISPVVQALAAEAARRDILRIRLVRSTAHSNRPYYGCARTLGRLLTRALRADHGLTYTFRPVNLLRLGADLADSARRHPDAPAHSALDDVLPPVNSVLLIEHHEYTGDDLRTALCMWRSLASALGSRRRHRLHRLILLIPDSDSVQCLDRFLRTSDFDFHCEYLAAAAAASASSSSAAPKNS